MNEIGNRPALRLLLLTLLLVPAAFSGRAEAAAVSENFEGYAPGVFPSPLWADVASFDPQPAPFINAPVPSARVVSTTDAFGLPTRALQTTDAVGAVKGVFTPLPVSGTYSLFADLQTVRYANTAAPTEAATDWSMQLTFAQSGVRSFYDAPQIGVYASSLTRGWRLFLIPSNATTPSADIDLQVAAQEGQWYTVSLDFDAVLGQARVRLFDTASAALLTDRTEPFAGWAPSAGLFDAIAFFGGEGSAQNPAIAGGATLGSVALVDNINVALQPIPLPGAAWLMLAGCLAIGASARRRIGARTGQDPVLLPAD